MNQILKNAGKIVGREIHLVDIDLGPDKGTIDSLLGPIRAGLDRPTPDRFHADGKDARGNEGD